MERCIQRNEDDVKYNHKLYKKYILPFQDVTNKNFAILDIGAGAGEFVKYIKEKTAFSISAVDLAEDTKDYLAKLVGDRGAFYHGKAVEDADIPEKSFDLVTLWGVLEHLPTPVATLGKIHNLLKEGGTLLLLIPNLFSYAFRILGVQVPTLNPREHINFFTLKSMRTLADACGFTVESMYGEMPVIDLIYPYVNYSESLVRQITEDGETTTTYIF